MQYTKLTDLIESECPEVVVVARIDWKFTRSPMDCEAKKDGWIKSLSVSFAGDDGPSSQILLHLHSGRS